MKKNSNIFERITYLSEQKGFKNISELAEKLGYKSPEKLYRLKRADDSRPSYDIIADFSNLFEDLNLRWFISGKGQPFMSAQMSAQRVRPDVRPEEKSPLLVNESKVEYKVRTLVATVDQGGHENIAFVPVKAQAGYLLGSAQPEYFERLPSLWLPGLQHGTFRAFEVTGYSMLADRIGFFPGDIVVGQYVENLQEIKDGRIYVIVNNAPEEDNIVLKRCLNYLDKEGKIICKSDNKDPQYPTFALPVENIKEVWEFKMKLTRQAPEPSGLYERINSVEGEIVLLKEKLQKLLPNGAI